MNKKRREHKLRERIFSVYALVDPRDKRFYYIGFALNPEERLVQHIRGNGQNPYKTAWLEELRKLRLTPEVVVIEPSIPLDSVHQRETYWIQHFLDAGMPLTNITQTPRAVNLQKRLAELEAMLNIKSSNEFILDPLAIKLRIVAHTHGYLNANTMLSAITSGELATILLSDEQSTVAIDWLNEQATSIKDTTLSETIKSIANQLGTAFCRKVKVATETSSQLS